MNQLGAVASVASSRANILTFRECGEYFRVVQCTTRSIEMAEKFLFHRLNHQNYQTWKTRMEMLLKREELWFVVQDQKPEPVTPEWSRADQKCAATIVLYIEDSQLHLVKDVATAKDAWNRIKDYHGRTTMTSRVALLKRICSLNLAEGGDMEQHLFALEDLFDRLASSGQPLEDSLKIAMIYRSLPESFGSLVTALESRPAADLTINIVQQKLLEEHQRRMERSGVSGERAMKLRSKGQRSGQTSGQSSAQNKKCFYCKRPGHFKKNCREFLDQQQQQGEGYRRQGRQSSTSKAKQATEKEAAPDVCFSAGGGRQKGCWYIDSGCSTHMTGDRAFFDILDESVSIEVVLADGSVTKSNGIGEGTMKCVDGHGKVRDIHFKEVLFIPALDSGLLSVRKLTQKGFNVLFHNSSCDIEDASRAIVAQGNLSGNLFVLNAANEAKVCAEHRHSANCQHTWHRRFGHRDPVVLDRIKKEGLGTGFEMQDCGLRQVCEECLAGKFARLPFPKVSGNRAPRILDLVHTDVCGPMKNVTPGGARYLMTLIDDHSRYTVVCLLRQKSDAAGCIKQFVAQVKNRFGRAPCVIRSDGGGEYVNRELKDYYAKEGIQAQYSAAYSPQQNGVAERKNRTLQEMATCMLVDAGLDRKYWGEAVVTAAYVQNRLPSRSVSRTPFELWFDRKPEFKHFRVFGSAAYVHVPDVKRSKLDCKAQKLIFVGYCEDRKAYRFLNTTTDTITISRDARFIELKNGSLENNDQAEDNVGDDGLCSVGSTDAVQQKQSDIQAGPTVEEEPAAEEEPEPGQESGAGAQPSDSEEEFFGWEEEQLEGTAAGTTTSTKRSTRGVLPRHLKDYVVDCAVAIEQDPADYSEAITSSESDLWIKAMQEEYASLIKQGTWTLTELPSGRRPIGCKWVYKRKEDSTGNVTRFKARLVAQGYSQQYGVDYDAVFAPVAAQTTLRVLLTIAGEKKMTVRHWDVKNAYLHGHLKEDMYMQQPRGFVESGKESLVCKLNRSLYGLKQSARVWNDTISQVLVSIGFSQSKADPCLWIKKLKNSATVYLIIYVDDMIVACVDEEEILKVERRLKEKIELTSLGEISHFLGIRVTRGADGFFSLDQELYIRKIANRHGLDMAKGSKIPLDVGYYRSREGSRLLPDNQQYHSLVGAILYTAVNTRPDVSASISILSRKIKDPTEVDWTELKRIVRYLMKTSGFKLKLAATRSEATKLVGYCDADWSSDPSDRKSNTGYLFLLGHASVCWASRKQTSVSLSSMEAEFIALSEASRELVWLRRLLCDMGENQSDPTIIFEDNQACINFAEEERQSRRSKHIDTRKFFTKDLIDKGVVKLKYCASEDMAADMLTKPLGSEKLKRFVAMAGLVEREQK